MQDKLSTFLLFHVDAIRSHINLLSACSPREKLRPRRGRRDGEGCKAVCDGSEFQLLDGDCQGGRALPKPHRVPGASPQSPGRGTCVPWLRDPGTGWEQRSETVLSLQDLGEIWTRSRAAKFSLLDCRLAAR